MNKYLLSVIILLFVSINAFSQITINRGNSGLSNKADTALMINPISFSAITQLTNQNWVFKGSGNAMYSQNVQVSSSKEFPETKYIVKNLFDVIALQRGIFKDEFYTYDDTGFYDIGFSCAAQEYSLADVTMTPTDVLVIEPYSYRYPSPISIIKFPTTLGSVNQYSTVKEIRSKLSVAILGMAAADVVKKTYMSQTDTVIGWGKCSIETEVGNSGVKDVLLVKKSLTLVDSVLVSGAPAPQPLLNAFSIEQGKITKLYSYAFITTNAKMPLITIQYSDDTYKNINGTFVNYSLLQKNVSVNEDNTKYIGFELTSSFVTNELSVITVGESIINDFEIIDLVGNTIMSFQTNIENSINKVNISELNNGLYLLVNKSNNKTKKFIVNR